MNATEMIVDNLSESKRNKLKKIDPNFWKANRWFSKYELAKKYYNHYKNIDMPLDFKTKDGINYDKNGISLGKWVTSQKSRIDLVSDYKAKLLGKIGIHSNQTNDDRSWYSNFLLAKYYYESHDDLQIPFNYVTQNGVKLGIWLYNQKEKYRGKGGNLTAKQIILLESIGIKWFNDNIDKNLQEEIIDDSNKSSKDIEINNRFISLISDYDKSTLPCKLQINEDFVSKLDSVYKDNNKNLNLDKFNDDEKKFLLSDKSKFNQNYKWLCKYLLVKNYFKHYDNVNISKLFKTKDGINYDEDGFLIGDWFYTQRRKNIDGRLDKEKVDLFNKIGINLSIETREEVWNQFYLLAKSYYEHNHNLKIPYSFKTIDGYTYSDDGKCLGAWYSRQKNNRKLASDRKEKLIEVGLKDSKKLSFDKYFYLVKTYYHHYGNLKIKPDFKTKDGITYNLDGLNIYRWLQNYRNAFIGKSKIEINDKELISFNSINMKWFSKNKDFKLQKEEINSSNYKRKQIEAFNRFRSLLLNYSRNNSIDTKKVNEDFMLKLDRKI